MEEPKRAAPRWFLAIRRPCKLRRHASRWRADAAADGHKPTAQTRRVTFRDLACRRESQICASAVSVGQGGKIWTWFFHAELQLPCRLKVRVLSFDASNLFHWNSSNLPFTDRNPRLSQGNSLSVHTWKILCRILKAWVWKAHLWSFHCFSILVHHTYWIYFVNPRRHLTHCRRCQSVAKDISLSPVASQQLVLRSQRANLDEYGMTFLLDVWKFQMEIQCIFNLTFQEASNVAKLVLCKM